jgi:hypothetical protein
VDLAAPGWNVSSIGPVGRGLITGDGAGLATGYVAGTAAVTTVLPEESGGQAPAAVASTPRLPPPRPADTWPVTAALIACAVIVVALIMALSAAHISRHGRRRGWRSPEDPSGWGNRPPRPRARAPATAADVTDALG